MTSRTTLLLIGAGLSLTMGSVPGTLHAQQPKPPLSPAQLKQIEDMLRPIKVPTPQFDPSKYPKHPTTAPKFSEPRPPAWLEFLKNSGYLAAPLFAAAVALALAIIIWVLLVAYRIIAGLAMFIHELCFRRDRDRSRGPRDSPSGGGPT